MENSDLGTFAHLKVTAFNFNMWNPVELLSVTIPKSMQKIFEKITIVTEGEVKLII